MLSFWKFPDFLRKWKLEWKGFMDWKLKNYIKEIEMDGYVYILKGKNYLAFSVLPCIELFG